MYCTFFLLGVICMYMFLYMCWSLKSLNSFTPGFFITMNYKVLLFFYVTVSKNKYSGKFYIQISFRLVWHTAFYSISLLLRLNVTLKSTNTKKNLFWVFLWWFLSFVVGLFFLKTQQALGIVFFLHFSL